MSLPDDLQFRLVETWDDAQDLMRWLNQPRSVLAVDTETTGFDWWSPTAALRLVQFGDEHMGWAIPFQRWSALVQEVFRQYQGPLVFHNAKFDIHWLRAFGCDVKLHLVDDTQLMSSLLEPRKLTALKQAARRWVDHHATAGQDDLKTAFTKAKWDWRTVPIELEAYWVYAALDTVLTAHLWKLMRPQIDTTCRRVYDMELAVMQILLEMELRGARVDLEYAKVQQVAMLEYAEQTRAWAQKEYGFNLTSREPLAAQLLRDGCTLTVKTKGGGWSMKAEVLNTLDHPLAAACVGVKQAEKMANSYFGNFEAMADENGIVHPGVKQCGARTGRMSVVNPAMQTLPRGRTVRDAFIAREGNRLLGIDYEQIEARVFTHFSEDAELAAMFNEGDFFRNMARRIYGDQTIEKADPRRQITKSAVYAKLFGAGLDTFAGTAKVPVQEAAVFLNQMDTALPALRRFQNRVSAVAKSRAYEEGEGYVVTPMGRREPCDDGFEYKLVNALIQGTCADIFKQTLVELDACGLTEYLVLPVHDEVIFDAPVDVIDELEVEASKVMRRDDWLVPLEVDSHQGVRLGDLK